MARRRASSPARCAAPTWRCCGAAGWALAGALLLAPAGEAAPSPEAPDLRPTGFSAPPPEAPDLRPTGQAATVARLVIPTRVRPRPSYGAPRRDPLDTRATWGGGPMRLLVVASALDDRDGLWVKVRLHRRPNDPAGWLPADRAVLSRTPWRIVVRLRPRTVSVLRAGRLARRFRAVVGAPATPTPRGLFAVAEEIRQPSAAGFLGPWALHLTAHSNQLFNYGGGVGRVAMHGRAGASLLDPLGSARSHGCIRVDNRHIVWLAGRISAACRFTWDPAEARSARPVESPSLTRRWRGRSSSWDSGGVW